MTTTAVDELTNRKQSITAGRHTFVPGDVECFIELVLGNFCSLAGGLKIISGQHPPVEYPECVSTFPFKEMWGMDYPPSKHDGIVKIGHDVWIGGDVSILEGVTVGNGVIIAACSVVTKDVPDYAVVAGNPAEIKKYRFEPYRISLLLKQAWWDWDDDKIKENMLWLSGKSKP